jgi:hypothetical protein
MQSLVILHDVRLIPAVKLEPARFATQERPAPLGDVPQEWDRYWRESLADAGLIGLTPLRPDSWHVPIATLTDSLVVGKLLAAVVRDWGGPECLTDPQGNPVLGGGLALCQADEVLVEPSCRVDLSNLSDWQGAAACRGSDWRTLWTGYPWLFVRYDGRWLILGSPHPSATLWARWAVTPDDLDQAVHLAAAELEAFADRLRPAVAGLVGDNAAVSIARTLAGLWCEPVSAQRAGRRHQQGRPTSPRDGVVHFVPSSPPPRSCRS